jgi:hypothetical protein
MKEEKKYPIKLETQNSDWINEWYDWPNNSRVKMNIIW